MNKKHNINIAFHNYKIKCTQNQTPALKWLPYPVRNRLRE